MVNLIKLIPEEIESVALSPDGSLLATSSQRSPVTLWDTSTGELIGTLATKVNIECDPTSGGDDTEERWNESSALSLAFSPDGKKLASAGPNGAVVWDVNPGTWVDTALRVANRR
jgi:WD40 repeat protein